MIEKMEDRFSADTDRVKKIIKGDLEIGRVVAGDVDADRIDYLQRDAHATGVEYGNIDADTIIRMAQMDSRRVVFKEKAVPALESLLTARFHMMKSVYLHNTCVIAEKMLERALENYVREYNVETMMKMDDYEAHNKLRDFEDGEGLYTKVSDRRLYKQALRLDQDSLTREKLEKFSDKSEKEFEEEIAAEAGLETEKVIVNLPMTPKERDFDIRVKKSGEVRSLSELTPIPEALTEAEWQLVNLNVYTGSEEKSKVSSAAEKLFS